MVQLLSSVSCSELPSVHFPSLISGTVFYTQLQLLKSLSQWIPLNALKKQNKTPWPLVRKRNIPTDRPPLVDKILVLAFAGRGVSRGQRGGSPTIVNLSFLDRSR
jgi:hypothetical protein